MKYMYVTSLILIGLAACSKEDILPPHPDPSHPGYNDPTPPPDTPAIPQWGCVTGEYRIDTTMPYRQFEPEVILYINAKIPYALEQRLDSMRRYVLPNNGMDGYNAFVECLEDVVVYLDAVLERDYPQYWPFRVERGAYEFGYGDKLPTVVHCNEADREEITKQ